ncbi:CeGAL family transcription factor [Aspergillus brunneoviolaceus CBS 621.78]|uniref:Fungal-specific transcription factor n=1 Tax=Aspergillus brunneoviolaceus CBS 621.78 TaxID=1450534 RepID=A0ACD1GB78_9EURO|nr:fungal-specific transcription factor [Aspergillus brunneoviolaceus CBS 621.78]RAH46545.1 fungal-specific transcription factor [Aspergillus brunneoviolaceus CBS 621.78]
MAIPRLAEGKEAVHSARSHRRHVSRACESCRQRKTKCTGDRSGCRNCRDAGMICCYTDGKREKSKRQMAGLETKINAYKDILQRLSIRYRMTEDQLIGLALAVEDPSDCASSHDDSATPNTEARRQLSVSEAITPLFSGFENNLDRIEEDLNRDEASQATGFVGQSSEISWLQTLARELELGYDHGYFSGKGPSPAIAAAHHNRCISFPNYHLDAMEIPIYDNVDPYSCPAKDVATKLYKTYLDWVHPSFPIIGTTPFGTQFQAFFTNSSLRPGSLRPGNRWLAILNLIFALATKYAHLSEAEWQMDKDAHLVYFLKAKALGLDHQLLTFPDLQQLQVEGLTALYMLTLGHVNRAWAFCGSAIRGSLGLGLHLRHLGDSTSNTSREIRCRVWWALYTLDLRLSVMTGRPSFIPDSLCTTPLPLPFDEQDFGREDVMRQLRRSIDGSPCPTEVLSTDQSDLNAMSTVAEKLDSEEDRFSPCGSLYFVHLVQLTMIAKESLTKIYTPSTVRSPWQSIEFAIHSLTHKLDTWLNNLPNEYDFTRTQSSHVSLETSNQRLSLALLFYSTRMGITRPCLRRVESFSEGDKMQEFSQEIAAECVESACHMLRLFPEELKAATLYTASPWWCLLHYLMQATAVLALELAFQAQHVPDKAPMVSKALNKAYEWLSLMSRTQKTPERARRLCDRLLRQLKQREDIKVSESPSVQLTSLESPADTPPISHPIRTTRESSADSDSPPLGTKLDYQQSPALLTGDIHYPSPHLLGAADDLPIQSESTLEIPSNYDEFFPYDTSTGQLTGSFFPTEYGMDVEPSNLYHF